MRSTTLFLFLILISTVVPGSGCGSRSFEGEYVGELRSEAFRSDGSAVPGTGDLAPEKDLTVKVRQDGDRVSVEISRSRILGDCEFIFKISKNGTAYIETPQTCTQSIPLEGTIDNQSGSLNLVLRGFESTSSRTFRFKGFKK